MILPRQHFSKDAFYLGQVCFTVVIDELLRGGYLRNVDRVERIRNCCRWSLVHFLDYVRKFLLDTRDNVLDQLHIRLFLRLFLARLIYGRLFADIQASRFGDKIRKS